MTSTIFGSPGSGYVTPIGRRELTPRALDLDAFVAQADAASEGGGHLRDDDAVLFAGGSEKDQP